MFKKILILAIPVMLAAGLLYIFYGHIILYIFSRTYDLDLRYKSLKVVDLKEMVFDGLIATDKKRGFGFSAVHANARPKWMDDAVGRGIVLDFDLENVYFMTKEELAKESYDSLPVLIATPFKSCWRYNKISGTVQILKKAFYIRNFSADSDDIRVAFTGDITYDYKVSGILTIYFAKKITDKIPDALSSVVLKDEEPGWKSFSVTLKGDYHSPSIEVTGKLFRLKINEVKSK